jgi:hypothetical protein
VTPVHQTRFGKGEGNCLAACVVSILDAPELLEELSDALKDTVDWESQGLVLLGWLRAHGKSTIPLLLWSKDAEKHIEGLLCIAEGKGPRGLRHAVVWRDGLLHDPHPDGGGLAEDPDAFAVIFSLEGLV